MEAFTLAGGAGIGGDPVIVSRIDVEEAEVIGHLAENILEILSEGRDFSDDGADSVLARLSDDLEDVRAPSDPAIARLLPDASPDDPEVGDEFRRLTQGGLRRTKAERLAEFADQLDVVDPAGGVLFELRGDDIGRFLATLTDIRLVLADRMEIYTDEDSEALFDKLAAGEKDDRNEAIAAIFMALGWWQESALEALSEAMGP